MQNSRNSVTVTSKDMFDLSFEQASLRSGVIELRPPPRPDKNDLNYRYVRPENKLFYLVLWANRGKVKIPKGLSGMGPGEVDILPRQPRTDALRTAIRTLTGCEIKLMVDCSRKRSFAVDSDFPVDDYLADQVKLRRFLYSSHSYIDRDPTGYPVMAYADSDIGRVLAFPDAYQSPTENHYFDITVEDGILSYRDNQGGHYVGRGYGNDVAKLIKCKGVLSRLEIGRQDQPTKARHPADTKLIERWFKDLSVVLHFDSENRRGYGQPTLMIDPALPTTVRGDVSHWQFVDDHWVLYPFRLAVHCSHETLREVREKVKSLVYL